MNLRTWRLSPNSVMEVMVALGTGGLLAESYVNEPFTGGTAANWQLTSTVGSGPMLTAPTIDPDGNGWLRLTQDAANQSSFAYYANQVPTAAGLVFTFDFAVWTQSASAADGFALVIFSPESGGWMPSAGGYGGSLGYAQRANIAGLNNALLGVGFDSHGNFSAPTEGREGGPGRRSNSVVIRGPMGANRTEGYDYIMGSGSLERFSTSNVSVRTPAVTHSARIAISPDKTVSVSWTDANGRWSKLILEDRDLLFPEQVMFGFTAGTGGSTSNQEVRNLMVTSAGDTSVTWDGGGTGDSNWGSAANWLADTLPGFGSTADIRFSAEGAGRLDNYLGADSTVRSLEFTGGNAGDLTLRTTTTADGTTPANLTFAATGDGASILVRETLAKNITIGAAAGNLVLDNDVLVAHHGSGELTLGRPVTGSGGLSKSGSGTLVLAAANTYEGPTTLLDGGIRMTGSGTLGASNKNLTVYGGTLDLNGTTQSKATIRQEGGSITGGTLNIGSRFHYYGGEFNATIQGNGGVDQWTAGTTLTLSNANTYAGTTVVRNGTLVVNNPSGSGTGTGTLTINGAGRLVGDHTGGTGVISGATNIAGTHAVGTTTAGTTGVQNFGGNLTYNSGSVFEWDLNTSSNQHDQVTVGGALTINDGAIFKIFSSTGFGSEFWKVSKTWSDIFGGKDMIGFNVANFQFVGNNITVTAAELQSYGSFSISGGSLNWSAVPEPGNLLIGLLISVGLMRRQRDHPMHT